MMRRATCSILAAVLLGAVTVRGAVQCFGGGVPIQPGMWGITGATLQDRTPLASGGPNLVLNGDFNFGTNPAFTPNAEGTYATWLNTNPTLGPKEFIQNWAGSGGSVASYPAWAWYVGPPCVANADPSEFFYGYCSGWNPTAKNAGASNSSVYFGNGLQWGWNRLGGSAAPFSFNTAGYRQSSDLTFFANNATAFGTYANPPTITQTVTGLTPGRRYRLQFFQGAEGAAQYPPKGPKYIGVGIAAIDISGYKRFYLNIPGTAVSYRTVDFLAKSTSHDISFMSWGHIDILGPQNTLNCVPYEDKVGTIRCATELALDDVILTECTTPLPACAGNKYATASVGASGKVAPGKTFTYTATLTASSSVAGRRELNLGSSKTPLTNVVFTIDLPDGVTLKSTSLSPKTGAATDVSPENVVTIPIGTIKAGGKVKVSLKLTAPSECSTPAPLGVQGQFTFTSDLGVQTVDVCPKKPLYVWQKGCPAIPKASNSKAGKNKL